MEEIIFWPKVPYEKGRKNLKKGDFWVDTRRKRLEGGRALMED